MSKLYKTLCCDHEYIGINHSPVLETGYCLHCGYHPKISKLKDQLKEALSIIEDLEVSNEFYAEIDSWQRSDNDHDPMRFMLIDEEDKGDGDFDNGSVNDENVGGKLARRTKQSTDQRIEKLKKEVL